MEIFQIVGIGIIATILVTIIKGVRSDFAIYVSIVAGVIIISMIIKDISFIISTIRNLSRIADIFQLF